MQARVLSTIFCDDARKEISGKDILIGVYSGRINVPAYPTIIAGTLWIEIDTPELGLLAGSLRVTIPSRNPLIEVEFSISIVDPSTGVVVVGGLPMSLEHDGDIVFALRLEDGPYEEVRRVAVSRAPA